MLLNLNRHAAGQLALWSIVALAAAAPAHAQVFPPDAVVEGKTVPEWVGENHNWEWWYMDAGLSESEARSVHPTQLAAVMNDGPVYFTAGYFGPFGDEPIVDHFLVPAGRPILQRALDFSWDIAPQDLDAAGLPAALTGEPAVDFGQPDPDALLAEITSIIEGPDFGPPHLEIDGQVFTEQQVEAHRVQYQAIVTIGQNAFGIPPGDWPQVGDGYWIMHEPLAPGERRSIRVGGVNPDGTLFPDITINYTAIPEPGSLSLLVLTGASAAWFWRRGRWGIHTILDSGLRGHCKSASFATTFAILTVALSGSVARAEPRIFDSEASFRDFALNQQGRLAAVETFEDQIIEPMGVAFLDDPLQANLPNVGPGFLVTDPSSDVPGSEWGFPNGLSTTSLLVQSNMGPNPHATAPNPRGAGGLFVDGQQAGHPRFDTGPAFFADSLDLVFENSAHRGVGFWFSSVGFQPWPDTSSMSISAFDQSGTEIARTNVADFVVEDGQFFGVWSDVPIGRINLFDTENFTQDFGAEAVSGIQMWAVPEPAALCLAMVAVCATWFMRRR